jgi:uncharacterized membrane protein
MRNLAGHFLRGLLITAPAAITLYICWLLVSTIDGWLGIEVPGAGLLVAVTVITLIGMFASNLVTRSVLAWLDQAIERLPFVRFLYTASNDLLNAFVGEHRRFNQPVRIQLGPTQDIFSLGFVTSESMNHLGLPDHVAVYMPQSYNFAGQLLLVPRAHVTPLDVDSAEVMAYIVSGGVAGGLQRHAPALPPG